MFQPCASLCVVVGQLHSDCGFIARELQCALSQLFGCPASSSGLLVAVFSSTLYLPFRVASFEEAAFLRACFPTLPCFHCFAAFRQRRFVVRVAHRSVWPNPVFSAWVFGFEEALDLTPSVILQRSPRSTRYTAFWKFQIAKFQPEIHFEI